MTAPRKHAEVIKAWADNIDIQYRGFITNGEWRDILDGDQPNFFGSAEWRIKPAAPKWPASKMTESELCKAWSVPGQEPDFYFFVAKSVANASLAHALESQQVVLMSEVQEIARELNKNLREKEKMAVAVKVRDLASRTNVTGCYGLNEGESVRNLRSAIFAFDLTAICASVQLP